MPWFVEKSKKGDITIVGAKSLEEKDRYLLATYAPGEGFHLHFPVDEEDEYTLKGITRVLRRKSVKPFSLRPLRKLHYKYQDAIDEYEL